ncbi:GGDEF domain-containing protein [Pseudidiomarina insulisalsae]|uniref:diguanylate cyclase n=1 Tax=Pseudidiomarina insulisalsae TaxID=575789 RepID=A0A432YM73_9GAMM|nr:sensor domain-containing diguanylate cyclase [Pseudidiomarina insulisalsae]RUO62089.1 PAS domain S-box protein [Pseudidiomarina insulisalsae]
MKDERDLSELIEIIPDAALVVNKDGKIVLVNQLAAAMFGYTHDELHGSMLDKLLPEGIHEQHRQHVLRFFKAGQNRPMGQGFRFLGVRNHGDTFHVDIMLSHVTVKHEPYAIAFIRDATQFKQTEDKIRRELESERKQALTDYLTGVGNRRAFYQELEQDIAELREGHHSFSVALIDLDDFKLVNDTFGHDEGDRALQMIAQGIREACRGSDFVARIGGDEFATIHPGVTLADTETILQRVRSGVIALTKQEGWQVSLTIGICHCESYSEACTVESILRTADQAMYNGKRRGKNQIKIEPLRS